jgi:hypothetical protein
MPETHSGKPESVATLSGNFTTKERLEMNANVTKDAGLPTSEQIREKAYYLWMEAGRPAGRDLEFWAAAERELADVRRPAKRTPVKK